MGIHQTARAREFFRKSNWASFFDC